MPLACPLPLPFPLPFAWPLPLACTSVVPCPFASAAPPVTRVTRRGGAPRPARRRRAAAAASGPCRRLRPLGQAPAAPATLTRRGSVRPRGRRRTVRRARGAAAASVVGGRRRARQGHPAGPQVLEQEDQADRADHAEQEDQDRRRHGPALEERGLHRLGDDGDLHALVVRDVARVLLLLDVRLERGRGPVGEVGRRPARSTRSRRSSPSAARRCCSARRGPRRRAPCPRRSGRSASMIFFTGSESAMRAYSTASCENQVGSA